MRVVETTADLISEVHLLVVTIVFEVLIIVLAVAVLVFVWSLWQHK